MILRLLVAACPACAMACAASQPASPPRRAVVVGAPQATSVTTDPAPRRAPAETTCDASQLPPPDVIAGNIAATASSGLGQILSSKVEALPVGGYVHFVYEIDVAAPHAGARPSHVRLVQGAESGIKPRPPGTWLFFSACAGSDGSVYEPDVGYVFPVDPACRDYVARIAASAAGAAEHGSACRDP